MFHVSQLENGARDISGYTVVKTLHSQCQGYMLHSTAKKGKKKRERKGGNDTYFAKIYKDKQKWSL